MHIKLTEYVRATTLTLNIKDAPRQTSLLIHDAFAKLVADLEELMPQPRGSAWNLLKETAGDVMQPVDTGQIRCSEVVPMEGAPVVADMTDALKVHNFLVVQEAKTEEPKPEGSSTQEKRRGRPPKAKEEPAPAVEPTPLEQAIAKAEDEQSQGEPPATAESVTTPSSETSPETTEAITVAEPTSPVSDFDMNSYLAKICNQSKGAAYKETIYELAKPFVEEGAVPRPTNIKGDDKRWQFIKAVEADSGVKYHG